MKLAIAAGGLFLGAGTVVSCESKKTANDPLTFPLPELEETTEPQDPLTSYGKFAAKMVMQEESDHQQDNERRPPTQAQATSPTDPGKYVGDMSAEELRIEEATRKAKQHSGGIKLFSGNGNMALSLEICRHLGINLGKATVGRFADGEANVVIHENVRGKDCYVIQPTCPPVNDNIMELLLMVSTLRRASARRITVVIPYYGYARQDRKMQVS
jgi:N-terminal domain of ribose phosphate pyrophosphokinase